jgi:Holliday junction resolvase RusA-like endonuclease
MVVINIAPIPKPRMTKRDKWARRPCVVEYFAYKDALIAVGIRDELRSGNVSMGFYLAMPDSWSAKKKRAMDGKPHQQKPDLDNLVKGVLDCLDSDAHIHEIKAWKCWMHYNQLHVGDVEA